METVDLSKAAGFQAVDSEGNVLGTVSMDQLTDSIASKLAAELSAQNSVTPVMRTMSAATTMAAATSTGSDKMETAFAETTDPAYVRVIDKNGNSAKQGISSLASVVGGLIGTATPIKNGLQSKANVDSYIQINNQTWNGDKVTTVKIIPYMSFFLSVPQSEGTQSAHALYFVSVDSALNVYCKSIGASLAGGLFLWKDDNYIYLRRGYGVAQQAGFINTCGLAIEVANNISLPTSGIDSVTIS